MATGTLLVSPLTATYGTVISNGNGESVLDLDERQIVDLFSRSGALVLRGFNSSLDEFRTFTDCYGREFLTYQGGGFRFRSFDRRAINDESTILSVTGGSQGFPMPLHGEMFYLKIRPRILWFRCEIPPERDGETTLGDGAEIFAALSPATRDLLCTRSIRYDRTLADGDWQTTFQTDDIDVVREVCAANDTTMEFDAATGTLRTSFTCSALVTDEAGRLRFINNILTVIMAERALGNGVTNAAGDAVSMPLVVRWDDGTPFAPELLKELATVCEQCTTPVAWQAGDIVMVDNWRVMHGRRGSPPGKREVYVRMAAAATF